MEINTEESLEVEGQDPQVEQPTTEEKPVESSATDDNVLEYKGEKLTPQQLIEKLEKNDKYVKSVEQERSELRKQVESVSHNNVETAATTPEVEEAKRLLKEAGVVFKDDLETALPEKFDKFYSERNQSDKRAAEALQHINELEKSYKGTPLEFTPEQLVEHMSATRILDPKAALITMVGTEKFVQYEASKSSTKKPLETEEPGKTTPSISGETEVSKFSVNNPDFDAIIKQELENKTI